MCVYLRTKFQVSSIILTSFRRGNFTPSPPQNETLKSPPKLGLRRPYPLPLNKEGFELWFNVILLMLCSYLLAWKELRPESVIIKLFPRLGRESNL